MDELSVRPPSTPKSTTLATSHWRHPSLLSFLPGVPLAILPSLEECRGGVSWLLSSKKQSAHRPPDTLRAKRPSQTPLLRGLRTRSSTTRPHPLTSPERSRNPSSNGGFEGKDHTAARGDLWVCSGIDAPIFALRMLTARHSESWASTRAPGVRTPLQL